MPGPRGQGVATETPCGELPAGPVPDWSLPPTPGFCSPGSPQRHPLAWFHLLNSTLHGLTSAVGRPLFLLRLCSTQSCSRKGGAGAAGTGLGGGQPGGWLHKEGRKVASRKHDGAVRRKWAEKCLPSEVTFGEPLGKGGHFLVSSFGDRSSASRAKAWPGRQHGLLWSAKGGSRCRGGNVSHGVQVGGGSARQSGHLSVG